MKTIHLYRHQVEGTNWYMYHGIKEGFREVLKYCLRTEEEKILAKLNLIERRDKPDIIEDFEIEVIYDLKDPREPWIGVYADTFSTRGEEIPYARFTLGDIVLTSTHLYPLPRKFPYNHPYEFFKKYEEVFNQLSPLARIVEHEIGGVMFDEESLHRIASINYKDL